MGTLLDQLDLPADLKKLTTQQLQQLAGEIRELLIRVVSENGGHLAPNLGVVELTLALHSIFDSPRDHIIWDVGHQSYTHKIITGRRDQFHTLRRLNGLSGFPKPSESEHDPFGTGHSSTSISVALGLAQARDLLSENNRIVAVIGDGALTGGMAYEALNHAGHTKADLLVVLNDNKMSIGSNVGGMSAYLGRIRSHPKYFKIKGNIESALDKYIPVLGKKMVRTAERLRGGLKYLVFPGMIFEELGLTYLGPVDGHNIESMKQVFSRAAQMKGPILVHVVTEKGKGYPYAEKSPEYFHGVGPFDLENGCPLTDKGAPGYTDVFSRTLVRLAGQNKNIVAITAAMASGTGLDRFRAAFPHRFFDVGIAEQHAVTMAAALACKGLQPVVGVYSTFLQRAFDQIIHDVCLQNLPVVFAVDRAGITGEDGETHQGIFDLSYLRLAPNMGIMAPRHENELQLMLYTALMRKEGPVAIRYPRGNGEGVALTEPELLPWGQGELMQEGDDLLIVAAGTVANDAGRAAEKLFWQGIRTAVINARFVKPLDEELILHWARRCRRVITVEENILAGGFGSAVVELLQRKGLSRPVKCLGIRDRFVEQGSRQELLARYGLDAEGIYKTAYKFFQEQKAERSL